MSLEKKNRSTRNLPVKVICPNTRHRIINQVIYEEYIYAIWNKTSHWARNVKTRLLTYDIKLSEDVIKSYRSQIKNGERDPVAAPSFGNDLFTGSYASRYGKDGMYKQFEMWCKFYAKPGGKYIGLPANQILSIAKDFGAENVTACERNETMAAFMFHLQRHFSKPPFAKVVKEDIFTFLESTSMKKLFSIFDFDLMCQINRNDILQKIVNSIVGSGDFPVVVNIATTVGRWITDEEYKQIMPHRLVAMLNEAGIVVDDTYSGGYNDRVIPMRYEFLALSREKNE